MIQILRWRLLVHFLSFDLKIFSVIERILYSEFGLLMLLSGGFMHLKNCQVEVICLSFDFFTIWNMWEQKGDIVSIFAIEGILYSKGKVLASL